MSELGARRTVASLGGVWNVLDRAPDIGHRKFASSLPIGLLLCAEPGH